MAPMMREEWMGKEESSVADDSTSIISPFTCSSCGTWDASFPVQGPQVLYCLTPPINNLDSVMNETKSFNIITAGRVCGRNQPRRDRYLKRDERIAHSCVVISHYPLSVKKILKSNFHISVHLCLWLFRAGKGVDIVTSLQSNIS